MEGKYLLVSGPAIIDKGKILLVKDMKDDFFKLPGGELNKGEDIKEACKRNVKEKLNAEIEIKKLLCAHVLWENPTTKEEQAIVLFSWLSKLKNKDLKLNKSIIEMKWFNLKDIKKEQVEEKISPNTMFAIGFL